MILLERNKKKKLKRTISMIS